MGACRLDIRWACNRLHFRAELRPAERSPQHRKLITLTAATLREEAWEREIGIAMDEWGAWHPEARAWGPGEL